MGMLGCRTEAEKELFSGFFKNLNLDISCVVMKDDNLTLQTEEGYWLGEGDVYHVLVTTYPKLLGYAKILFGPKKEILKCSECGNELIEPDEEDKRNYRLGSNEYTTVLLACPWGCVSLDRTNLKILDQRIKKAEKALQKSIRELEKAAGMPPRSERPSL